MSVFFIIVHDMFRLVIVNAFVPFHYPVWFRLIRERYLPPSFFLQSLIEETAVVSGSVFAERNLSKLIKMTEDTDARNRDCAVFLLAQSETDTPAVRDALLHASRDPHATVRQEAVLGIARLAPQLALPLVLNELKSPEVTVAVLEAAALCADAALVHGLRECRAPTGDVWFDHCHAIALRACETGTPEAL